MNVPEEELGQRRQPKKRLIETCIRLFPEDMETIKQSDELKVGVICRTLVHNFLEFNGYSQMDLMQKIRKFDEEINDRQAKKVVLEHQLTAMLNKKFEEEEKLLIEEKKTLYFAKMKNIWAEQLFTLRKSSSLQGKVRTKREDTEWVKAKIKGADEFKDYSEKPDTVLSELESIIKSKSEEFDKSFESDLTRR